jgi:TonB family protein
VSHRVAAAVFGLTIALGFASVQLEGQQAPQNEEIQRRAKSKVEPIYPEIARKMKLAGTVKIQVVVLPNGVVKEARVLGGHPVLAIAALDAAKKWRFEPAAAETSGLIDFKFEPQ